MSETKELTTDSGLTHKKFPFLLKDWIFKNRYYFFAFIIPIILTYIAYAIFGISPFGEESVLCLDLNGQYVYYYEAFRDAVLGDGSIFYNWSRNLSGEFMGTIGYYTASPFMWLLVIIPEKYMLAGVLVMQLAKIGTSAVTFSYYAQKSKKISPINSLIFAVCYSMMAYTMIQLIDPMWLDGVVYLPLIMLGIEYLVDYGKKLNLIIPLALMFIAHFYIGYMIGIFTAIYFIYYLFFGTLQRNRTSKEMIITIARAAMSAVLALMCSAVMLVPMYCALKLGKFEFTEPDFSFKFQFDLIGLIRQLLVDQYDSVNVQGSPEIYCGVLTVVMIPLFFMNSKIDKRRKIGYIFLLVLMFLCMAIRPVDMAWHGFQSPNWLPYRYSFVYSFILLSMAAESYDKLDGIKPSKLIGVFVGFTVLASAVYFIIPKDGLTIDKQFVKFEYKAVELVTSLILSIGLCAIYLILIYLRNGGVFKPKGETIKKSTSIILSVVTLIFVGAEVTFNATNEFDEVDKECVYSTKKSWDNYIENGRTVTSELYKYDDSLYRCEKTFFRCINDNMAFGLKGLSHSTSVMNSDCLSFLEAMGYVSRSYYSRYDGNTPISDSLLGIKYVLSRDSDESKILCQSYEPVFTYDYTDENDTAQTITAYKNPDALSIGYMVSDDILTISALGNDNPFNSQNIFLSTLLGETEFDTEDGSIGKRNEYYKDLSLDSDPICIDVEVSEYGDQTCYTDVSENAGDPGKVDFDFTVTEDSPIYFYFRTENEKSVNLWYGPYNEETGDYDYQFLNTYFETEHYCIMSLGSYEPGTKVSLRMTIANEYTIFKNFYFVYFDEALYQESIDKLKDQQWQIDDDWTATKLSGTITAEDDQIMLTSIPYEKGWTITVDGEKVEPEKVVNALIGIPMTAGEHVVTMKYTPPGWWMGIVLLNIGIVCIVFIGLYDRKNKKHLIAIYNKNTSYLSNVKTQKSTSKNKRNKKR
jgi:uncharacterized membrane protein YfhO